MSGAVLNHIQKVVENILELKRTSFQRQWRIKVVVFGLTILTVCSLVAISAVTREGVHQVAARAAILTR